MNAPVLVINCGSSSIKYALIDADPQAPRLAGLAERLGSSDARLKGKDSAGESFTQPLPNADHADALNAILQRLEGRVPGAVGHRIVHGGEHFTQAALIDDSVIEAIETTAALAPLHNPTNLAGIHQTLPPRAYRYALPEALYTEHGIRRYGFHGTSHAFVSQRAGELSSRGAGGWLTAHLGNGCSTSAVWNNQSLDTSMGLTPLEGLVMGTRSGDVDPGLHAHLHRQLGWSVEEIDNVLNKQSGLLGLSGLTNDMREVEDQAVAGHPGAKLALDVFCYRIAKSLAALSCALPKLDGVIFTGGIGENSPIVRREVLALLPHFGFSLDEAANEATIRGKEGKLDSAGHQGPEVWVIPTDEEGRIAMETRHCVETAE